MEPTPPQAASAPSWWRSHGWTVALLLSAFGIALLIRTLWMAPIIEQFGPLNVYGGGSDSFYHSRVMSYIILNHHNLVLDPLLKYPSGAVNPREPLFDWMNAVLGILFAPLFGGNAVTAGAWFLDADGPIWSALGVFPIYLIGREVSSRRTGILAAFFYPLMVANIDSSTLGYANYLSFYTFVILVTVFAYLRTVKASGTRRFVTNYRDVRQYLPALRQFFRVERMAVKWAVFTGVCFGTLALAWQGYTFGLAVIVIFLFLAMIVERIRRVDSFGLYVTTWIVGLVGFPMAAVYYVPQGLGLNWFGLPLVLFLGAMLVLLPFLVLRDQPWVVSIPVLAGLVAAALAALYFVNRADFTNIVTGQGYFVKNLIYSTVAEAQSPSIDALIVGYGVGLFFLAFAGLAFVVYTLARQRMPRVQMLFLVFGIVGIYLPISAAKFFFLGSAAFALLASIPVIKFFEVANFESFRRTVAQLSDRRSQFTAFRRGFKPRHILIPVFVCFLLVAPTVWYAVDAGIPYNSKSTYDQQIFNTLPPPLRVSAAQSSSFYLGAAGTELDTPNQYDEAGYNWLAQQDLNVPEPDRPAFISWWDYGFQAAAQGLHPTVADNFQNGIDPSGNFLLSQNESLAIGILTTTLLSAEQTKSGDRYLPAGLNAVLAHDGVNLTTLHDLLVNTTHDVQLVLAYPDRYLPVDASHLDGANAMYDTVSYFLASTNSDNGVAQIYNDVQAYTGWEIRYAMVDNRLFPYSGSNTGIFYAPADLTDRIIGSGGAPTTYFTITALGSDGNTYQVGAVPAGVQVVQYNIAYSAAFYNSMIYRVFVGYNGTDIGQSAGIPGLPGGSLQSEPIEPGWMMQHFQVVYRTAYYCPYANPSAHPGCYTATNLPTGQALAKAQNGSLDSSGGSYIESGGEAILEYYPGQTMTGIVSLPDGRPVSGAHVTVDDGWGIPHEVVATSSDGAYSVVLPPGNDTVNVTIGTFQPLSQQGTNVLAQVHVTVPNALGLNLESPVMVQAIHVAPATVQGFVYWNTANNSTGFVPGADATVRGANVTLWGPGLQRQTAVTDASGAYDLTNVPPGVYNFSVTYRGSNFSQSQVNTNASANSITNRTIGLKAGGVTGYVTNSQGLPIPDATITAADSYGVVGTATTNASGGFIVTNLGPANYSVSATEASGGLASSASAVTISSGGTPVKLNLTVVPFVSMTFAVIANGNPAVGVPVRLTPIQLLAGAASPGPNSSGNTTPVPSVTSSAQADSLLFTSGSGGFVTANVPVGNYSAYALGFVGSTLEAGLSNVYVPPGARVLSAAPLFLAPADRVSGILSGSAAGATGSAVELLAFDAHGDLVTAFANGTAQYTLYLPAGVYTLYAVGGLSTTGSSLSAGFANVTVSGDTTANLVLQPAQAVRLRAGFPSPVTGFFPAAQAEVRITAESNGATLTFLADSSGNVSFVLPDTTSPATNYCIRATALGYAPFSACDLSPASIAQLPQLAMQLAKVPVTATVYGLPSGSTVTLNFTATGAPAETASTTGTAPISLSLYPGSYSVTAWARSSSGGLLLPASSGSTTVPFGSISTVLSVFLIHQVTVNGSLRLPAGVPASGVSVRISSPSLNLSLSGTEFQSSFYLPPGSYSVYATVVNDSRAYARLESLSVGPNGGALSPVDLTGTAARLVANLTRPGGSLLNATFPVTIVGPGGITTTATAVGGVLSALLPANQSYAFSVATTQLVAEPTGNTYETFHVATGSTCALTYPMTFCAVALTASTVSTPVVGALLVAGDPTPVAGTLRLVGPDPATNVTILTTDNGTFSTALAPGSYAVYATGTGAGAFANVSTFVVPASGAFVLNLTLGATWTDTVTLTAPSAGVTGLASVSFAAANGATAVFSDEPLGIPLAFALPAGVYQVTGSAPASPYGVVTNATATATAALLQGNSATTLALTYRIVQTASLTLQGATTVTLGNGGVATFAFSVLNTGNAPEALHFVGSPVTWNFSFSPENLSLGTAPSNRTAGVELTIAVPVGTAVSSPAVQIEAELPDGTAAGFAQPLPKIVLSPTFGLVVGHLGSSASSIGPVSATLPFYVRNTGTVSEALKIQVADAGRLAGLGWNSEIDSGTSAISTSVTLGVGGNNSYTVHLTAATGAALPPGSVSVSVTLLNDSSDSGQVTIPIPTQVVNLNSTGLFVTGPGIGSPPTVPDWLIPILSVVPAIAVAGILVANRYWKTRSWSRR